MLAWIALLAHAGPWVHPPGTSYSKVSLAAFEGAPAPDGARFQGRSLSAYTEIGLVQRVELLAELPFVWATNRYGDSALSYRSQGPGTARLGVGVRPPGIELPAAVHAVARVPLAAAGGTPLDPPLGDTQLDLEILGSIGASPALGEPARGWLLAEVGTRHRTSVRPVAGVGRPGVDALYRVQAGVVAEAVGWASLEASGQEDLRGGISGHRVRLGVAAALGRGVHAELEVARVYLVRGTAPGWSGSAGLSLVDRTERERAR